jgi:putative endonuclease
MKLLEDARRMAPNLSKGVACVYILELRSGALYVGCSTDCEARFRDHEAGTACQTPAPDPPGAVRFIEINPDLAAARQREAQLKKWSRAKKQALIAHDFARLRNLSRSHD